MLKLYGRATSVNVQKALWTLGELGLAYERIDVGGQYGGLQAPEFLAMNPHGRIPTIDDDGVVVWESNAVVRYLAALDEGDLARPALPSLEAWHRRLQGRPAYRQYVMSSYEPLRGRT